MEVHKWSTSNIEFNDGFYDFTLSISRGFKFTNLLEVLLNLVKPDES